MKKMLVVEDDTLSQNVIRRIFKSDFEMDFCESVDEYYEKYSNTKYDIIIMDISLKGIKNGFELIKEIKAVPTYAGIPILCLTAHAQTKMKKTAMESGSDIFIVKPVPNRVLKEAVASLIDKTHKSLS
jgi:DNA-binding response OmpR family regulator